MIVTLVASLHGCDRSSESAPEPAPITPEPVLLGREQPDDEPEDALARLEARVAELEAALARCQTPQGPSEAEAEARPVGVELSDAPAADREPAARTASTGDRPQKRQPRTRPDPASLLDTLLDSAERGDTIVLPNPAKVLMGDSTR